MGEQNRKKPQKREKISKWLKVCEQCGNENITPKKIYQCKFCNWWNGEDKNSLNLGKTVKKEE